jgi:hypothetical protein
MLLLFEAVEKVEALRVCFVFKSRLILSAMTVNEKENEGINPEPASRIRAFLNFDDTSDAGDALHLWWSRRILANKTWKKLYALEKWGLYLLTFCLLFFLVFMVSDQWHPNGFYERTLAGILVVFFVAVRLHLASIPALTANSDFMPSSWTSYRAAPIRTSEIFRAMYTHAWWFSVLPAAVLGMLQFSIYGIMICVFPIEPSLLTLLLVLLNLVLLGFAMSGIAYIGGQIWRSTAGILAATGIPIILQLFLGIGPIITMLFGITAPKPLFRFEFLSLVIVPEIYMNPALQHVSYIPIGMEKQATLFGMCTHLVFAVFVIWNILHVLLVWRRRNG